MFPFKYCIASPEGVSTRVNLTVLPSRPGLGRSKRINVTVKESFCGGILQTWQRIIKCLTKLRERTTHLHKIWGWFFDIQKYKIHKLTCGNGKFADKDSWMVVLFTLDDIYPLMIFTPWSKLSILCGSVIPMCGIESRQNQPYLFQNHPQGNMNRASHELTYTAKVSENSWR